MEWGTCAPGWGSMDTQQEVTLTDVLSNDVLCNVLKHCQPLGVLPLTCRAFRAALRSSGTQCTPPACGALFSSRDILRKSQRGLAPSLKSFI